MLIDIVEPSVRLHNMSKQRGADMLSRIEQAGRVCYQSHGDCPEEFVAKLIKRGHLSVLEHESVTATVVCDRGVSHEIVRHRIGAYSQESTRYCAYKTGIQVIMPFMLPTIGAFNVWRDAMYRAATSYKDLLEKGISPQIARSVLPTCLKTEIVVTYNLRQWRHFLQMRTAKAAHPQMQEIAGMLLEDLQHNISIVFDDIG